jgi:ribosomal protein L35
MPKLKTRKTLIKRVRITSTGKVIRKQTNIGHLKTKWDSSRSSRKHGIVAQSNKGHKKLFRKLLAKAGKGIK